jgi:hypothetical protein
LVIDVIRDGHFVGGDKLVTRNANPYLFWFGVGPRMTTER